MKVTAENRKWYEQGKKGVTDMAQILGIGNQDFEVIRKNNIFYVDKTEFIREWWEAGSAVTLITRPRRFGKTLMLSMVERFFSLRYENGEELFDGLRIWQSEKYRQIQGTYPVIFLSFANVKGADFDTVRTKICWILEDIYRKHNYLPESDLLDEREKDFYRSVNAEMSDFTVSMAISQICEYLFRYYGKKVILLLDEYDTPLQEAYLNGYMDEMTGFMQGLLNPAFKTNPCLERGLLTGITRTGRESMFSDLNNLDVVSTTSGKYETAFGFTEEEVFAALEEYGLSDVRQEVKRWYDGFTFGKVSEIYNPWSILHFLESGEFGTYWANTSSNRLAGELIRRGNTVIKEQMQELLSGKTISISMDEQIVFSELDLYEDSVWSFLLAGGYLRVVRWYLDELGDRIYELALTNLEIQIMFRRMIRQWFGGKNRENGYNRFVRALLNGDVAAMTDCLNEVALHMFSFFDTGKEMSERSEPERFYHGFVLGLTADLAAEYSITSNRESGYGRYDVVLEPKKDNLNAVIIEFKVFRPDRENDLADTVRSALAQIEEKKYAAALEEKGISPDRIRKYGFAFRGKEILIGE